MLQVKASPASPRGLRLGPTPARRTCCSLTWVELALPAREVAAHSSVGLPHRPLSRRAPRRAAR